MPSPPSTSSDPISAKALRLVLDRSQKNDNLGVKIQQALKVIDEVLAEYGEEKVALSFNGGKDCTVLVHLLATALYERHQSRLETEPTATPTASSSSSNSTLYPPISAIYITAPYPFPSLESFVESSIHRYNLDLERLGGGMKVALEGFLQSKGKGVKAVLVGTRRGDPHGASLSILQNTDPTWPSFLRVHPILDWTYADIWQFLRELEVGWCELYDEGYTSLGSTKNTHPNPCLSNPHASSGKGWDAAWCLKDERLERAGRDDVRPSVPIPIRQESEKVDAMAIKGEELEPASL